MERERTPFRTLLSFYHEPSSLPYEKKKQIQQDPSATTRLEQLSRSALQESRNSSGKIDDQRLVEFSELLWNPMLSPEHEKELEQLVLNDPLLLHHLIQTNAIMNYAKQLEAQISDEEIESFLKDINAPSNQQTTQTSWKNIYFDFMNYVEETFASSLESLNDSFYQFQFALQNSSHLRQKGIFPKKVLSEIVARGTKSQDIFLGSVVSKSWEIRSQGTYLSNIIYQNHDCTFTAYLPKEGYVYVFQLDDENTLSDPLLLYPTNEEELCLYSSGQKEIFEYHFDENGNARFLFVYSEKNLLEEKLKQLKKNTTLEKNDEWPSSWIEELKKEILSLEHLKKNNIKTCEVYAEILSIN